MPIRASTVRNPRNARVVRNGNGKGSPQASRFAASSGNGSAADLHGPDAVVRNLGAVINWARLRSFDQIQRRAGVDVDRSGIIILTTLERLGPMRMSDLAAEIGLDRSTISRQVGAVVRAGFVQKTGDAADARASQLQLTSRGHSARRKLSAAWHSIVTELLLDWSADEQAQLGRLLGKLALQMRTATTN